MEKGWTNKDLFVLENRPSKDVMNWYEWFFALFASICIVFNHKHQFLVQLCLLSEEINNSISVCSFSRILVNFCIFWNSLFSILCLRNLPSWKVLCNISTVVKQKYICLINFCQRQTRKTEQFCSRCFLWINLSLQLKRCFKAMHYVVLSYSQYFLFLLKLQKFEARKSFWWRTSFSFGK